MPAYARTIERFLDDACIEGGKAGLHQCHVRKVAAALHIHLIDPLYLVGQAQALGGRAAIGAYQTARPQLHSTEPAPHQYRDTVAAFPRSEARRVGKAGVGKCRYRWSQVHSQTKTKVAAQTKRIQIKLTGDQ